MGDVNFNVIVVVVIGGISFFGGCGSVYLVLLGIIVI